MNQHSLGFYTPKHFYSEIEKLMNRGYSREDAEYLVKRREAIDMSYYQRMQADLENDWPD